MKKRESDLKSMLEYCSANIPYYGGKGDDINEYDFLDKKTIRENYSNFCIKQKRIKSTGYTSGTSGTPSRYYRDLLSIAHEQYCQERYFKWKNKYMVVLRGEKIFGPGTFPRVPYRILYGTRTMYVSSYHLNEHSMGIIADRLERIKNKCLWAYPSAAYVFADFCKRNNRNIKFSIIATSSEKLLHYQIKLIEEVFSCRIKEWYGQGERTASFGRCVFGNYHEIPGYSYVELIKHDTGLYEIAGTSLYNRIMPLVRYKTGDLVELSEQECKCGFKGPCISEINGRNNDYLLLPQGIVSGNLLNAAFKKVSNVLEAQVIQKNKNNIVVKIRKNECFSLDDEAVLKMEIFNFLPEELCSIEYTDYIEKTKAGKLKFVINEIAT